MPPGSAILRWGNASIWLATGLLVLAPGYREVGGEALDQLHLPHFLMWATCAAEVVLALIVGLRRPGWMITLLLTGMVVSFTLILSVSDPALLVHPLGVLTKNLPILALILVSYEVHRKGWTPRATNVLRAGMAIVWITEGTFPKLFFQQAWELEFSEHFLPFVPPSYALYAVGVLQVASGVLALVLRGNALRAVVFAQLCALIVLPTFVGIYDPSLIVHPFGPLTKNLPIIAGTALVLMRVPPSPFFTSTWKRLCMFHFRVPEALARKHLPPGVELDMRDGSAWVSFVSLEFERTRVLGIPVPGHVRFGDVNLRLYVKRGADRGVVFIREIVPLPLAAFVARTIFGEPFIALPMRLASSASATGGVRVAREIVQGSRSHKIDVEADAEAWVPDASSEAAFFKERYFAFGHAGDNLRVIRVEHPPWAVREVKEATLDVDFRKLYGEEWGRVLEAGPAARAFVEGSDVVLHWPEIVAP
jgi:uncharacterized protein YqjF (DUF2071 family)/uncharacterized membrane protein YphA (DoxX/SURF4 family)